MKRVLGVLAVAVLLAAGLDLAPSCSLAKPGESRPVAANGLPAPSAAPAGPASSAPTTPPAISPSSKAWAAPLDRPGLPNLHKVTDDLYRGAQPEKAGFAELKALGVRTVVNLRSLHGEGAYVAGAGLAYEHIYFEPWENPEDRQVAQFLKLVTDKTRTPVYVHCAHGSDRTGTMCAVYRIVVCGWTKEEAIREMKEGGFGFHAPLYEGYARYVEKLDVEAIKRAAGME